MKVQTFIVRGVATDMTVRVGLKYSIYRGDKYIHRPNAQLTGWAQARTEFRGKDESFFRCALVPTLQLFCQNENC